MESVQGIDWVPALAECSEYWASDQWRASWRGALIPPSNQC
jgi:hypothetical protein